MPYTIRPATTADGAACAAIYAPYIETAVTFESPAPDAAELSRRIADTLRGYPWLVCERDGRFSATHTPTATAPAPPLTGRQSSRYT